MMPDATVWLFAMTLYSNTPVNELPTQKYYELTFDTRRDCEQYRTLYETLMSMRNQKPELVVTHPCELMRKAMRPYTDKGQR